MKTAATMCEEAGPTPSPFESRIHCILSVTVYTVMCSSHSPAHAGVAPGKKT